MKEVKFTTPDHLNAMQVAIQSAIDWNEDMLLPSSDPEDRGHAKASLKALRKAKELTDDNGTTKLHVTESEATELYIAVDGLLDEQRCRLEDEEDPEEKTIFADRIGCLENLLTQLAKQ